MEEQILIASTYYWDVYINQNQACLGYCIVVLKRKAGSLSNVKSGEWKEFHEIVIELEGALRKTFGATMFNWSCLMNNAYKEKPYEPQVHWHFKPRYDHIVEFGGQRFEDNEFGKPYPWGTKRLVSVETLSNIAEEIKKWLK